jgi:hypothetical protein
MGAISPGQIAFNYPDQHYGSHETYLAALADALSYEYKAIADAGLMLQIDSPDMAMAAHCRSVGSSVGDWHTHLPLAVEALNAALDGIPREQVRLHVCWGNYAGPHHKDVPLAETSPTSSTSTPARSTSRVGTPPMSTSGASSRKRRSPTTRRWCSESSTWILAGGSRRGLAEVGVAGRGRADRRRGAVAPRRHAGAPAAVTTV